MKNLVDLLITIAVYDIREVTRTILRQKIKQEFLSFRISRNYNDCVLRCKGGYSYNFKEKVKQEFLPFCSPPDTLCKQCRSRCKSRFIRSCNIRQLVFRFLNDTPICNNR